MPDVFARLAAWLLPNTVTSILRRTPASSTVTKRARLSIHRDRNEDELFSPIVSLSLVLPATFSSPARNGPTLWPSMLCGTGTWSFAGRATRPPLTRGLIEF
jgi:hypothetical protein